MSFGLRSEIWLKSSIASQRVGLGLGIVFGLLLQAGHAVVRVGQPVEERFVLRLHPVQLLEFLQYSVALLLAVRPSPSER